MSLHVVFLGTAASVPTVARALSCVVVQRKGELLMFDCGEGVQRQMMKARVGFHRKMKIFLSHLHGDHILGLPGLLQTMSMLGRERRLEVYGPVGIKAFTHAIKETVQFNLSFQVEIKEIEKAGTVCSQKEYEVVAAPTDHQIRSLAYALIERPRPGRFDPEQARALDVPKGPSWSHLQHGQTVTTPKGRVVKPDQVLGPSRPGRKIVYSGDTKPVETLVKLAENADLLIHEATLDDTLLKRAAEEGHSTPSQAAETAKKAQVKRLILTHLSSRYKDTQLLQKQARKVFPHVDVAEDFMKITIPLSEG